MNRFTLQDVKTVVGGELRGLAQDASAAAVPLARVVIDSREITPGDVFWALPGQNCDGADYAPDAFSRGAAGVVVSAHDLKPPRGRWLLVVDDPKQALWQLAEWQRERFSGRVIAVTGSAGKTTTRQMIDTVLASRFDGACSQRNFNNHLGVPLSMLQWEPRQAYAVLEMGASAVHEIALLAGLSRPQIGVITNIGDAHLGGFGSADEIANAKTELLRALPKDGLAVLNGDDARLRRLAGRSPAKIQWVGRGADNDLVATDINSADGQLSFTLSATRFTIAVWGRHHLTCALAAVAVGREFGLSIAEIRDALAGFEPPPMRCQVLPLDGSRRLINDAYNASPTAMRAALELLGEVPTAGRRIVVCGDMRELGPDAPRLHRQLGDEVVTLSGADVLVACGEHAREVVDGATAAGMPRGSTIACHNTEEAGPRLAKLVGEGDVILLKGSRAMALEKLVAALGANNLAKAA